MRTNGLVELQKKIDASVASLSVGEEKLLVFEVCSGHWAIDFPSISAISTCGQIAPLWVREGVPPAIIGMSASDGEILTVIDGGLVFGMKPVTIDLKSRLITFEEGPLRGIALLVERILDPILKSDLENSPMVTVVGLEDIASKLKLSN